jgi:hypothetical protein
LKTPDLSLQTNGIRKFLMSRKLANFNRRILEHLFLWVCNRPHCKVRPSHGIVTGTAKLANHKGTSSWLLKKESHYREAKSDHFLGHNPWAQSRKMRASASLSYCGGRAQIPQSQVEAEFAIIYLTKN